MQMPSNQDTTIRITPQIEVFDIGFLQLQGLAIAGYMYLAYALHVSIATTTLTLYHS